MMDASTFAGGLTLARARAETPAADVALAGLPGDVPAARSLMKRDPLAYGAWATALLATHLDQSTHGPSIAVGTRSWGYSAMGLVPLGTTSQLLAARHRKAYAVGFVVDGPGRLELARCLADAGTSEVHNVPLAALVGPTAAAAGRADIDLRLAP